MFSPLAILFTTIGAAHLAVAAPSNFTLREPEAELLRRQNLANVYSSCTVPNTVALTFDDGPYNFHWDLVEMLNREGIKATFFLNGNNWRCIYDDGAIDAIRHGYESGHMYANHLWSHPHANELSWDQVHDEMWKVELALKRIIGVDVAWMRPPYGEYNDMVRSAAAIRGQQLVIWDFDSGDSAGNVSPDEQKGRYDDLANSRPDNILTLNHETYQSTVYDVIPHAIQQLKAKGYNFVTVAECLGQEPYRSQGHYGTKDDSWQC